MSWEFIVTAVLAVAAILGVFLNYMFRPTKIEVERRHSDTIKEKVVKAWKSELPPIPPAKKTPSLPDIPLDSLENWFPEKLKLRIMEEYFFDDIHNHVPPDIPVFFHWETFKKAYDRYMLAKYDFCKIIFNDVIRETGLQYNPGFSREHGFSSSYIDAIYGETFSVVNGGKRLWLNAKYELRTGSVSVGGTGLVQGDENELQTGMKIHKKIIYELPQNTEYLRQARKIEKMRKTTEEYQQNLIKDLNEIIMIPLLPGKCKYIKWSTPGFIDGLKKIFYKVKKSFQEGT